jgi:KaiC
MRLSSPIYTLKRQAKVLARTKGIKLSEALNRIAGKEGFSDWGHLASSYAKAPPARDVLKQLRSGDIVLVGARPGQGKTLLGLELVARAAKIGRTGYVFTLEDTEAGVWGRFETLGFDAKGFDRPVVVDTSDDICAEYIIDRISAPDQAFVVVDYLQLLDQRRSNAPLADQVWALKAHATRSGAIVVMISQIDRAFELSLEGMPGLEHVRLPNPVDLSLFDKRCFLHGGEIQIEDAA